MYHLFKQTHTYTGDPYCGYTSDNLPAERETLEEAIRLAMEFDKINPVGWNIYNANTGDIVFGVETVSPDLDDMQK
jgi:hypothetical protein